MKSGITPSRLVNLTVFCGNGHGGSTVFGTLDVFESVLDGLFEIVDRLDSSTGELVEHFGAGFRRDRVDGRPPDYGGYVGIVSSVVVVCR